MTAERSTNVLPVAVVGVAVCCGISALLVAAIGATLLGIAVEAWVVAAVGLFALIWLAVGSKRRSA